MTKSRLESLRVTREQSGVTNVSQLEEQHHNALKPCACMRLLAEAYPSLNRHWPTYTATAMGRTTHSKGIKIGFH